MDASHQGNAGRTGLSSATGSASDSGQLTFADVGEDLAQAVFVVVDLETTGGPATAAGITEIGAVKVQGGQILGEFATLVRPEGSIPPHITALTGIEDSMLRDAPSVAGAVAAFGEFAGDAILVAHNAPYDLGFLKAACALHELSWFPGRSLDTARLARVALLPGEVRNCKLATLAAHFRAPTTPNHRALADARATTHVLHCLIERVGSLGVRSWADLRDFISRVSGAQRAKRHLADGLPTGPGVYTFVDRQGSALYVGTSTNVRSRVRSYFTAAENRARMSEMIAIAERVEAIPCATTLEAHVREIRYISALRPHYNRRSRQASTSWWLRVEEKPSIRLVAMKSTDGAWPAGTWGPFTSRTAARGMHESLVACLRQLGDRHVSVTEIRDVINGELRPLLQRVAERLRQLAAAEQFEAAASLRDHATAMCVTSQRHQRFRSVATAEQIVAASPDPRGGWAIHVIRRGRLVSATHAPAGHDARSAARAAVATAEATATGLLFSQHGAAQGRGGDHSAPLAEEALLLAKWLEGPGVRLVDVAAPLAWPIGSGSPLVALRIDDATHRTGRSSSGASSGAALGRPVGPAPGVTKVSRIAHAG